MNNRDYRSDYSAGPTSAANQIANEVQIAFTGTEGDVYVVLATCCGRGDGAVVEIGVQDNNGSDVWRHRLAMKDTATDYFSAPIMFLYTVPAGGAVDLGVYLFSSGATSVTLRNTFIGMFKLLDTDAFVDGLTGSVDTTSDTTFAVCTNSAVTFDVPFAQDYLIITVGLSGKNSTAASFSVQTSVTDDELGTPTTTTYSDTIFRMVTVGVSNFWPYASVKKLTLAAGQCDIHIEHKVTTSGTVSTNIAILAIPVRTMPAVHENEDTANFTTTSTTYVENTNIEDDYTLGAQETLLLSYGIQWRAAANVEHQMKSTYDGTTFHETSYESVAASSQSKMVHMGGYTVTPTAGPHTIEQYLSKESTGVTAANLSDAAIVAIMFRDDATVWIMGANIYGAMIY